MKIKIAVVLATRGLVFTQVIEALEKQRKTYDLEVFYSHNLPLPDSQNALAEQALNETDAAYILFIEEDTVLPDKGLELLLMADADIACIDYGVNGWSCTAREQKTKEILWCGLGCTLVKRRVFLSLEKPYFRSDLSLRLNDWQWVPNHEPYGQQDIRFCMLAREQGFRIVQVPGEARHMQLNALGKAETNKGLHDITQKPWIENKQFITIPEEHVYHLTTTQGFDTVEHIGN